jgi:hypothetical protein
LGDFPNTLYLFFFQYFVYVFPLCSNVPRGTFPYKTNTSTSDIRFPKRK